MGMPPLLFTSLDLKRIRNCYNGSNAALWAGDVEGHLMYVGHYAGSFTEGMLPCYLSVPPKDTSRGVVPPPTHFTDEAAETLIDHEVTESGWRTGIQI